MVKKKAKKVLSLTLAMVMMVGTIAFTPQGIIEAEAVAAAPAATTAPVVATGSAVTTGAAVMNVNLGIVGLTDPTAPVNPEDEWKGSKVYLGDISNSDLWRVLDLSTGLLLNDNTSSFCNNNDNMNTYYTDQNYKSDDFSELEQQAMDGDLRILTVDEVKNPEYGFANDVSALKARVVNADAGRKWWLQKTAVASGSSLNLSYVSEDGSVVQVLATEYNSNYLVPALNFNFDSVLYIYATGMSRKTVFTTVKNDYVDRNKWKLVLKDSNTGFKATRKDGGGLSAGTEVKVNVSDLGTFGPDVTHDRNIYAMLVDSNNKVLCYGKSAEEYNETGDYTFTIPSDVTTGHKFYVFTAGYNGSSYTMYASNMVEPAYTSANRVTFIEEILPSPTPSAKIEKIVNTDKEVPETTLDNEIEELKDALFTEEELKKIEQGEKAKVYLELNKIDETVNEADKKLIEDKIDELKKQLAESEAEASQEEAEEKEEVDLIIGMYIDLNLFKQVGNKDPQKITNPSQKLQISIKMPDELINNDGKTVRSYWIIRIHDGKAEAIEGKYDPKTKLFTFETDEFSTYALAYRDVEKKLEWAEASVTMEVGEKKTYSYKSTGYDTETFVWMTSKRDRAVVAKNKGKTEAIVTAKSAGTDVLYVKDSKGILIKLNITVLPKAKVETEEPYVAKDIVYIVKSGDTLNKISIKYKTTVKAIAQKNNIKNPDLILIGQKLVITQGK